LGLLRESSRQEYAEADKDFALYLYFKLKVIQRQDWDEERFLENLPEVRKAVEEQKYVDGLQYFVEQGFAGNATGAWVPEKLRCQSKRGQHHIISLVRPYFLRPRDKINIMTN
jgi:hypothetical protein